MSNPHGGARIYFTDFFGIQPEVLEDYGAFNISLVNDLPLFIDPFLLFDSEQEIYGYRDDAYFFLKIRSAFPGNPG